MWKRRTRLSLIARFNLASLAVLVVGCAVLGAWVWAQIESRVLARVGHTTALFAGSVVAPVLANARDLETVDIVEELSELMSLHSLGDDIRDIKLWSRDGTVVYSSVAEDVGMSFDVEEGMLAAWNGLVSTEISELDRPEHERQRASADRLIETYAPVREPGTGEIIAVLEFYQTVHPIENELRSARVQSWLLVTLFVALVYLVLVLLVRGGSRTIVRQRDELESRVAEQTALLAENGRLSRQIKAAAERATALNEQYLTRIASELHDGPAQDIGYALLGGEGSDRRGTLTRALEEIRNISAGLKTPELDDLSVDQVVRRAVAVHASRTGRQVPCRICESPAEIGLAAKTMAYRVVQEALNNAYRHANDDAPIVTVRAAGDALEIEVSDCGPGIDSSALGVTQPDGHTHLGLAIMKERVELLGGRFALDSNSPTGTVVRVRLPARRAAGDHEGQTLAGGHNGG